MHKRGRRQLIRNVRWFVLQVERNINLVYGGGNIGLMGQVAQMVHNSGGDVVGVIPKALIGPDLAGHTVGESIIVNDMHQRKAEMARRSEAFIALPGFPRILNNLAPLILQTTCCLIICTFKALSNPSYIEHTCVQRCGWNGFNCRSSSKCGWFTI